ncbi:MAG: NAD(P)/FAD-dependent oxidoreductase, partial [Dehalococcoidia bacterium]
LYEREALLGGQLNLAVKPPHKGRIQALIDYFENQLRKLGVIVKLETEITSAVIENNKPDAVVIATGVGPFVPEIPGIKGKNVAPAEDVLCNRVEPGSKVVIIGGELVGCETAEFLADRGRQVTITRRGSEMALNMPSHLRAFLLPRLREKGVTMMTGVKYEQITDKGLTVTGRDGQSQLIEADTIVLAAGARPNTELMSKLQGKVPEIYAVGDCSEPRGILEAIADGSRIARLV